jgi:hypothetical protein
MKLMDVKLPLPPRERRKEMAPSSYAIYFPHPEGRIEGGGPNG